jgi:hypothetical protein
VTKFVASGSMFKKKRGRRQRVLSKKKKDSSGEETSEAYTQEILKIVIPGNQYIDVICMNSYCITLIKTIKIQSCAKPPRGRLC